MASANNNDDEESNPYLAMRKAKIARNQKRLRELGLLKPPQPPPIVSTPRTRASRQKQKAPLVQGPARRSSRLSSQARPEYTDVSLPSEKQPSTINRKRSRSPPTARITPSKVAAPSVPSAPAANSVRGIKLDVKTLLGKGSTGLLGKMVEHTGKEFVINQSFSLAATAEDQHRLANSRLSFNKYCGVQEWNNCIFLWVNLGTSDSPNEFLDDAKRVTWFGGSRMHDESPVIHKLLQGESSNIILWCRRYQKEVKNFTPYVCFGRMGYNSHVPGSRPLSFVWDLLDYNALKNHIDLVVRDKFEVFTKLK